MNLPDLEGAYWVRGKGTTSAEPIQNEALPFTPSEIVPNSSIVAPIREVRVRRILFRTASFSTGLAAAYAFYPYFESIGGARLVRRILGYP